MECAGKLPRVNTVNAIDVSTTLTTISYFKSNPVSKSGKKKTVFVKNTLLETAFSAILPTGNDIFKLILTNSGKLADVNMVHLNSHRNLCNY